MRVSDWKNQSIFDGKVGRKFVNTETQYIIIRFLLASSWFYHWIWPFCAPFIEEYSTGFYWLDIDRKQHRSNFIFQFTKIYGYLFHFYSFHFFFGYCAYNNANIRSYIILSLFFFFSHEWFIYIFITDIVSCRFHFTWRTRSNKIGVVLCMIFAAESIFV